MEDRSTQKGWDSDYLDAVVSDRPVVHKISTPVVLSQILSPADEPDKSRLVSWNTAPKLNSSRPGVAAHVDVDGSTIGGFVDNNEEIWIKRGKTVSAIGVPIVILIAGSAEAGKAWWGEYFLLVNSGAPKLYHTRTGIDTQHLAPGLVDINHAYIKAELELQVNGQIVAHCSELYEKHRLDWYMRPAELEDGEQQELARTWIRGHFHEQLKAILAGTQSQKLKDYLRMVTTLPSVTLF